MTRSSRWLTAVSVLSALVLTAQAEWTLAQAVGWTFWVAWAWPASLDTYVLAALRAGRDRAWALGLMSVSVCGSHALPILWPHAVPWWVAGGLSIVPPLVAWRVHELMRGGPEVDQGHEPMDHAVHPMTPEVDQGHEPMDHAVHPMTLLTPGVGYYLDQVSRRVVHQVDQDHEPVDGPGPLLDPPMTPAVQERVIWAMGEPDVASTSAIMTQFNVSLSTAKRVRQRALELTNDLES